MDNIWTVREFYQLADLGLKGLPYSLLKDSGTKGLKTSSEADSNRDGKPESNFVTSS
jgi:hypothetical protein